MRQGGNWWRMKLSGKVGFWITITVMLSATLFLAICSGLSSGIGSLEDVVSSRNGVPQEVPSGFIVIDMSKSVALETHAQNIQASVAGAMALGIGPLPEGPSLFEEDLVLEEVEPEKTPEEKILEPESGEKEGTPGEAVEEVEPDEAGEAGDQEQRHWVEYYVKAGDTLIGIGEYFSLPAEVIAKANALENPHFLMEGQELLIPLTKEDAEAVLAEVKAREKREKIVPVKTLEIGQYTVREGDSLWSIANSFNLDINTLFGCNDMKNPNYLRVGTTLRIPNQDGVFYKVEKGDTLAEIASKFGVTVGAIQEVNGFSGTNIAVGKELFLPGAKPVTSVYSFTGGSSGSSVSAGFRWPLSGRITSGYGWRRHPFTNRRDFHTGIDIKGPTGRIIRASKAGRVVYSGWMGGYGRVVVIDHGKDYSTLYAHCSSLLVRKGQRVSAGQAIAKVGSTGRSTGPHLHFEVRYKNKSMNPLKVLR
ncbi:MAG: LysM peptidoglycan-binding domain-containing protein [Thermovirgaceae bacterium]